MKSIPILGRTYKNSLFINLATVVFGLSCKTVGHALICNHKMRPLSPTLAKMALEELNETPDRIKQDLIILRVWIEQQPHLKARTTEAFLIAFLRRCRYSLEDTKERIDKFFSYYNIAPEIFAKRVVNSRILDINRMGLHFYPEYPKCNNQMALLITRFGKCDYTRFQFREILQFSTMAMEIIALENDNATIAGVCQILDFQEACFEKMHYVDKELFAKWINWLQDCCPLEIKEIYFLNMPKEMQRIMTLQRALMPWRQDFPTMVKSLEDLYNYVPQKCLPEEYGGCNGHVAECISYMEDQLKSYRSYFQEDSRLGTIERLRKKGCVCYETGCSIQGSFRKLETD